MTRTIANTDQPATRPWPEHIDIQGGQGWADSSAYHDEWFFEAFPPGTFIRATGPTMAQAETTAWKQWEQIRDCPAAPDHGPFEARGYTNGLGFCTRCGGGFPRVLPARPDPDTDQLPPLLALALLEYLEQHIEGDYDDR